MNEYANRRRHYGLLATGLLLAAAMPFDLAVADAPCARAGAGSASTALSASDLQATDISAAADISNVSDAAGLPATQSAKGQNPTAVRERLGPKSAPLLLQ